MDVNWSLFGSTKPEYNKVLCDGNTEYKAHCDMRNRSWYINSMRYDEHDFVKCLEFIRKKHDLPLYMN